MLSSERADTKAGGAGARARAAHWRNSLLALLVAIGAVIGVYLDTAIAMVTIWYRSETFTHAFVVPPIVLWLIWRRRHQLAELTPRAAPVFLIPMALMAAGWFLGALTAINSVTQFALVAMLVLTVPVVLGAHVAYRMLFPLCFLFFAVPVGEFLTPLFMIWTADFTVMALRFTGIPVLREGLQFVIPSGNWSVVEACSGIRYLIASVTVGALFAHLNYQSTQRRILFVLVSVLVPVVANWLRAYMIVMVGHLSGNTLAVGVDHLVYGWVFFGVVILLMFWVGGRWAEAEPSLEAAGAVGPGASEMSVAGPGPAGGPTAFALAGMLLIVAAPLGASAFVAHQMRTGPAVLAASFAPAAGWSQLADDPLAFSPDFKNPSAVLQATYSDGTSPVGVFLAYYRNQTYDRKLVSSVNTLAPSESENWNLLKSGAHQLTLPDRSVTVRTGTLRRLSATPPGRDARLLAWQIYWIDGNLTANDYLAKAYSAVGQMRGHGDESAALVFYTLDDGKGSAAPTLERFLRENYGAIDALLKQTRDAGLRR
jgi:exosortase A